MFGDPTIGGTNNYGIYSAVAGGSGKYNIYVGGSAANNFGAGTSTFADSGTWTTGGIASVVGVSVGGALPTSTLLCATGTVQSPGVTQYGVESQLTGTSAATTSIQAFNASPATASSSFTCTNVIGFQASAASAGATSTISNDIGFLAKDRTAGTANIGLESLVSSGSSKWNIYASGTANNAFAGNVAIGSTTAPTTALVVTGTATFPGTSALPAMAITNAVENVDIVSAAPSSTQTFYVASGAVQLYTTNAANNWILNFGWSAGTTMNTALTTGQSVTVCMLVTQGATAYYCTSVEVDGTPVTVNWQGGAAPIAGNASGIDSYNLTIIKTGSATYTTLASLTRF